MPEPSIMAVNGPEMVCTPGDADVPTAVTATGWMKLMPLITSASAGPADRSAPMDTASR